jgi:hypothetical protein
MRRTFAAIGILLGSTGISAEGQGNFPEKVYILADSLDWILSLHTVEGRPTLCQVTTREQPGPRLTYFYGGSYGPTRFRFPLEGDPAEVELEEFTFWRDDQGPVRRGVSVEERHTNALIAHYLETVRLLRGAKRLRVRATYRGVGNYQDLEFDVRGLNALAPDLEPRCPKPPAVIR